MTRSRVLEAFGTPLDRLMSRPNVKAAGEDKLSVEVADYLRESTITGAYRGVWFHVPNQGHRSQATGAKFKAMGLIPGVPDFALMWEGGCGLIELKTEDGALTRNQRDFVHWCGKAGVSHAVCRSVEDVHVSLLSWGAIPVKGVTA